MNPKEASSTPAADAKAQSAQLPPLLWYQRVQEILENQPAFRCRLSPKTRTIETHSGEKLLVSAETVVVTEAFHAKGKNPCDASLQEVLLAATPVIMRLDAPGASISPGLESEAANIAKTAAPAVASVNANSSEAHLPKRPTDFDFAKYPHYSVQTSIFSLLLSALNMSEHYEKFPNAEIRLKKLEDLVRDYQDTCDPLKFTSSKTASRPASYEHAQESKIADPDC